MFFLFNECSNKIIYDTDKKGENHRENGEKVAAGSFRFVLARVARAQPSEPCDFDDRYNPHNHLQNYRNYQKRQNGGIVTLTSQVQLRLELKT